MVKRPLSSSSSPSSSSMAKSRVSSPDNRMDYHLIKILGTSDISVGLSFDRLLDSAATYSDQVYLIDRAVELGSSLISAGVSSLRTRSSKQNSIVWPLPPELTIKVFSFLDTQSLFNAAVTCSMFKNCYMDPLCYSNIDLTTARPKVDNKVVSTLIHRAGRVLESLKLGIIPARDKNFCEDDSGFAWSDKITSKWEGPSFLTRRCLLPLSQDCGTAGLFFCQLVFGSFFSFQIFTTSLFSRVLLRRLHLYNIERLDNAALILSLAACKALIDLEIVFLHVGLQPILLSLSKNCQMLERLFFQSSKTGRDDSLRSPTCVDFVTNCPHISFLALRGFKFQDFKARLLVKGLTKLKHLDFSRSYSITGSFLRNHGNYIGGNLLEVLILRDCIHLKEVEVSRFLNAILAGDFKLLTYLDISNRDGLASERCSHSRYHKSSNIAVQEVIKERPGLHLVAEFPFEGSRPEMENVRDDETNSSSDGNSNSTNTSSLSSSTSDSLTTSSGTSSSDDSSSNDSDNLCHFR